MSDPVGHGVDELSIHELMQRTDAARLLDEATRRLAGAIDLTDTDEGLERVQTELVAASFDAIRSVIRKENECRGYQRITHGRHCTCRSCAVEDWSNPDLAPCGMHGADCPALYQPWGSAGTYFNPAKETPRA